MAINKLSKTTVQVKLLELHGNISLSQIKKKTTKIGRPSFEIKIQHLETDIFVYDNCANCRQY